MCRITRTLGAFLLALSLLILCTQPGFAGRTGGPGSDTATIGPHQSIFVNIPFDANELAIVSVVGNGRTNLDLFIYDADRHQVRGVGFADRKTVSMMVYRAGTFRVEIRNLGPLSNSFVITTN